MEALTLLRDQATLADNLLTQVFANVTPEQAVWRLEGSTANPIAPIFLHAYHTEDRWIQQQLQSQPTILDRGGWRDRLGYDPAARWAPLSSPDLDAYRAYAAEVRGATRRYLDGLDPAALEREVPSPRGPQPLVATLSLVLVAHKLTHTGEIAALVGCQGVKGFPF